MAHIPNIPIKAAAYTGERAVQDHRAHANTNGPVDGFAPAPSAVASGLERFNSVVGMPMMVGFFATMLSVPIGWMTSWNKTLNTYVKGALGSVNSAMQTPMGKLHELRANAVQPFVDAANANGLTEMATKIEAKQAVRTAADAARLKPMAEAVGKWSASAETAKAGTGIIDAAVVARGGSMNAQAFAGSVGKFAESSKGLEGAALSQASAIERHAGKLASLVGSKEMWAGVKQGGAKALVSGLPKALGRMPLMHGLFALTAATGAVALLARTRTENIAKNNVLHSFAADVLGTTPDKITVSMLHGPNANPLVARAAADVKAYERGKGMTNSMQIAIDGAFAAMPNPGMMMVPMMMGGQVVGDMLGHETLMLDAYATLKMAEAGKGTLEPKQHLQLVRSLVAASPTIAAHGGVYNKMALPIAETMVAEKMNVRDMLREIATPNAIEARAVKAQEAAKAKVAAAPVSAAHENADPKIAGPAKVQAATVAHEGVVVGQEKAAVR